MAPTGGPDGDEGSRPPVGTARSRLLALIVAVLALSLAGYGLWRAFADRPAGSFSTTPPTSIASTPDGYYVLFPTEAGPPGDNPNGGATLSMTTNLPDGTLVWLSAEGIGGPGGDSTCCPGIKGGSIEFQVNNGSCYLPPGAARSTGFTMTVKVLPRYRFASTGIGNLSPPTQPASVRAILGPDFERLTGAQVRVEDGVRQLVATATFDWPADTCEAMLRSNDLFLPDVCPTTDTRGKPLAMIQAADPEALMDAMMPAIAQIRLCELWRQWMVLAFREAHPWPQFRDSTKAWIDGLGNLAGTGEEQVTTLTWEFVMDGPDRYVADVILRGKPVALVEFVPLPFPKDCRAGCQPFWGITGLEPE